MRIEIKNDLRLTGCPESLQSDLCTRLTMANPVFQENERMGRWNGKTPRLLRFYSTDQTGALILPRGYINHLVRACRDFKTPFTFDDLRNEPAPVNFGFNADLRSYQVEAVEDVLEKPFGTLAAPTGSGKTVMALAIIARRRLPALIVVHTKELLAQWIDRIEAFLEIPREEIGVIGNGRRTIGDRVTVALVQSLYRCAHEVAPLIGHLIVDECHRCPSRIFTEAVTAFDCKFMMGLSATPWRRDKLSKLIFWHLGDVRHKVDAERLADEGSILRAEVIARETEFRPHSDPSSEYSRMLSELTENAERNCQIAGDVAREAKSGMGICLVLSDRKAHCDELQRILCEDYKQAAEVLTGDMPAAKRQVLVERLNAGGVKVLVATGQLIGEGFDCRELSTLFFATPIRFDGRVLQYLGRVLRPAPGKNKAKVFDYVDVHVGPLIAAAMARRKVYQSTI